MKAPAFFVILTLWCLGALAAPEPPGATNQPGLPARAVALYPQIDRTLVQTNLETLAIIAYDAEFPLLDTLTDLAQQANIGFALAPELLVNGKTAEILTQPVGRFRLEQVTPLDALQELLAKNSLLLGKDAATGAVMLGTRASKFRIPEEGVDLAKVLPVEDNEVLGLFDPNKEVSLLTAINVLGRVAKLKIMIDPVLKTGGFKQVGTNALVPLPSITNLTLAMPSYEGPEKAKETLEAILDNNGLAMTTNKKNGFTRVSFKEPPGSEPMVTFTIQLRYSNSSNIVSLLQAIYPPPRVMVREDLRTAQLVVSSTEAQRESITELVMKLDAPTPQVLIEARFLETFQNPKSVKGIDWTDTLAAQRFTFGNGIVAGNGAKTVTTTSPGAPVTTTLPNGRVITTTPDSSTVTRNVQTDNSLVNVQQGASGATSGGTTGSGTGSASGGSSGGSSGSTTASQPTTAQAIPNPVSFSTAGGFSPATGFLNAQGVSAVLSFLNTEADTRVLATPRVVTLDNQETVLKVVRTVPKFNVNEGLGAGGATVSASSTVDTNEVGTILTVTPRISGTNVGMRVKPEISKVEPIPSTKIVQGKVNEADVTSRSTIETHVMVPSGNTLVMGGLISDSTSKAFTKVPILGDIPVLGLLFRHESKEQTKANLIIFITPTILADEDFQPTRTDFLNTPRPNHQDEPVSAWDGGAPKDWKKKKPKAEKQDKSGKPQKAMAKPAPGNSEAESADAGSESK